MSNIGKDLREYQGFQGEDISSLDFDRQREEDDSNREKLKRLLKKKKNELLDT